MNKIISMSVWGNDPRYIIGAERQVELAKKFYPGWKVRIYTDNVDNFKKIENDVELVPITDESYGMFWRFLAMFESEDNVVMVRDSDSRITEREAMAVNEWMESDKVFHTFKDHEAHYEFPIIGCAFAFKGTFSNELLATMINYMNSQKFYLSDQFFLRDYIWPLVENNSMVHSMKEPGWFAETRNKLKNPYSFCGNGYDEDDMPIYPNSLENISTFNYKLVPPEFKFDGGALNE